MVACGYAARALTRSPTPDAVGLSVVWYLARAYARLIHRLRVEGREHALAARGPLIIVANHTAGVDPVLIQSVCPVFIRWVMAQDMRLPRFEWFWRALDIIFVDRRTGEVGGTREAVRHLREGGVLGIFPEGGLERPARRILPFLPGVGLIIKRTGARVLPVIVDGTPECDPAWASLWRPSRSRLRFMPPIDYRGTTLTSHQIAEDLRARFAAWTGWPMSDGGSAARGRPG